MDGWVDGWVVVKAILRIAYSIKKFYQQLFFTPSKLNRSFEMSSQRNCFVCYHWKNLKTTKVGYTKFQELIFQLGYKFLSSNAARFF